MVVIIIQTHKLSQSTAHAGTADYRQKNTSENREGGGGRKILPQVYNKIMRMSQYIIKYIKTISKVVIIVLSQRVSCTNKSFKKY